MVRSVSDKLVWFVLYIWKRESYLQGNNMHGIKSIFSLIVVSISVLLTSCSSNYRLAGIENNNQYVQRLDKPIARYASLRGKQWPEIVTHTSLKQGDVAPEVQEVRARLVLLGDMRHSRDIHAELFDDALKDGVSRFQARHGLKADGVLGKSTIKALNVSPSERLRSLQLSQVKWSKLPSGNAPYIQVNIPSYELSLREGTEERLKMRVVVGQKNWPTPELTSQIKTMVLNPKWNVPRNIVEKEIVHKMVEDENYLAEQGLQIYENWKDDAAIIDPKSIDWTEYTGSKDLPYRLSQAAGDKNALGQIKFIFPNDEQIYLHDTQATSLFALPKRNFSHGCIRLESPLDLMNALSQYSSETHLEKAASHLQSGQTRYLPIEPMPLYITYATAWVDDKGVLNFREDIYGHHQNSQIEETFILSGNESNAAEGDV